MKDLKRFLHDNPTKKMLLAILLGILWGLTNAWFSNLASKFITVDRNSLISIAVELLVFILGWTILEIILDVNLGLIDYRIEASQNAYYLNRLYHIKPEVLKTSNTGYISTLLGKCIAKKRESFEVLLGDIMTATGYLIYFTIRLYPYSKILASEAIIFTIVGTTARFLWRHYVEEKADDIVTEHEAIRDRLVYDGIANINTVQKLDAIGFMSDKLSKNNEIVYKSGTRYTVVHSIGTGLTKIIGNSCLPIMLITVFLLNFQSNLTEVLVIVSVLGARLVYNLRVFERFLTEYTRYCVRSRKLEHIASDENKRPSTLIKEIDNCSIKDFTYEYVYTGEGAHKGETVKVVIPEFSFNKGDKVCIYGESGQGKTTLLNIISGELECNTLCVNGRTDRDFRVSCSFMSQDTEILDLTLRDNIKMGRDVSDDVILNYIQKVGLGEWLTKQPDGLDTVLGERGVFVSTGQRQRINLIRVLIDKNLKDVFLLDEPTSNVDDDTEKELVSLIQEELKDKTLIIVTHKPAIREICDTFYEFRGGVCYRVEDNQ